jgi:hypothetical protein
MSLLNLYNELKAKRLIPDAYFQRNLVWRDIHKKDFIDTILLGYPFPQIFISKGKVDVETMQMVSCIVDGQQRCDAITNYIENKFAVDGRRYEDLSDQEKKNLLAYDVAVMELELENDDPKVQEIFKRINRTSNSLTAIEKLASEYSTSEFMLVAKLLSNHISAESEGDSDDEFSEDPNIPEEFFQWAKKAKVSKFQKLINEKSIYSTREIARKVNLMHTLNIISTIMHGFFNRNEKTSDYLETYKKDFQEKDNIINMINNAADLILKCGFSQKSYWLNKANIFTIIICLCQLQIGKKDIARINPKELKEILEGWVENLPEDYKINAAEAVNSKRARQERHNFLYPTIANLVS